MIAAILRAQLLSMRMAVSRGAIFSAITGLVWYGVWCVAGFAACAFAAEAEAETLGRFLPVGFMLVCIYWQVVPVLSASMGSSLDLRKLLLYPAPHAKLFLVEALLRLMTAGEMLIVMAGVAVGLLRNPAIRGWTAAPRVLGPVLLFVLFNVLLASGLRSLLERLMARRRVREVVILGVVLALGAPRLVIESGYRPSWLGAGEAFPGAAALPWATAASATLGHSQLASLIALVCWTAFAAWFGRWQFERSLRYDAVAAQATDLAPEAGRGRSWADRFFRLPSLVWSDPMAALVEKELRSLARTPRFRMVFIMGFSFGLLVWLPVIAGGRSGSHRELAQHFLTVVCVYALTLIGQVSYWNCFGFDRSATEIYFAIPQPVSKTLLGKNAAALIFIFTEVAVLTGITAVLPVNLGAGQVLETLLVMAVCSLYVLAMGNITSVQFPRPLNPERVSQGGTSSRFQALVFVLYPLALLPVFLAYLAQYALDSRLAFYLILAVAALVGAVLYWVAMESAVNTASKRRERILQELSRGEGPVTSE